MLIWFFDYLMPLFATFQDFCTTWGDTASVVGLFLGVIGFAITIWAALRSKTAAEAAAAAALQAKSKILKQGTLFNFSTALAAMDDIVRLNREKEWEACLDRHSQLDRILVELNTGIENLSLDQQAKIQGCLQQLKTIENQIEGHFSSGKPEPDISRLNRVVKNQITILHGIAVTLKTN
jgi:hypothetical protein